VKLQSVMGVLHPTLIWTGTGTGTAITRPTKVICDYSSHRSDLRLLVPSRAFVSATRGWPKGP